MSRILRPLIFVGVISFMLGLWLSLRKAESNLFAHLKEPSKVTLLTDQPDWWQPIARKARMDGIAQVEVISPSRRRWNDYLDGKTPKCDLVATASYFLPQFHNQKWLEKNPRLLFSVRDQIHPDFRDLSGALSSDFLPLLWSVTYWQKEKSTDPQARLVIYTSLDEALLVALDLHPAEMDMIDPEGSDPIELAKQLWSKVEGEISLSLNQSEYTVPLAPIKARQYYAHQVASALLQANDELPNNGRSNLWYYGAGVCPHQTARIETQEFLQWLLKPENMALLAQGSGMSVTVSASDNDPLPKEQRPSFLRQLPLGLVKGRELPWDLAAAWTEFWLSPQETKASR